MKKIITKGKVRKFTFTTEEFLHLLDIDQKELEKCLCLAPLSYRNVSISKKDGGARTISIPKDELKIVQRVILDKIFSKIHFPPCVYGFSKGKTIIENAKYHANSDYLLNLDIQDFFPSIHFEKVKQIFKDIGFDDELSEIMCKLTTYEYKLPQGAPTSPFIASLALNNLDYRLLNLARANYISFTRYFDDLCFSGGKRIDILKKDIAKIISQEGYRIKKNKRQYFAKGETKEINGISITTDGKLFLKSADDLISYLNELMNFGFLKLKNDNPEKECVSLAGKIAFLKNIDQKSGNSAEQIFKSIMW